MENDVNLELRELQNKGWLLPKLNSVYGLIKSVSFLELLLTLLFGVVIWLIKDHYNLQKDFDVYKERSKNDLNDFIKKNKDELQGEVEKKKESIEKFYEQIKQDIQKTSDFNECLDYFMPNNCKPDIAQAIASFQEIYDKYKYENIPESYKKMLIPRAVKAYFNLPNISKIDPKYTRDFEKYIGYSDGADGCNDRLNQFEYITIMILTRKFERARFFLLNRLSDAENKIPSKFNATFEISLLAIIYLAESKNANPSAKAASAFLSIEKLIKKYDISQYEVVFFINESLPPQLIREASADSSIGINECIYELSKAMGIKVIARNEMVTANETRRVVLTENEDKTGEIVKYKDVTTPVVKTIQRNVYLKMSNEK